MLCDHEEPRPKVAVIAYLTVRVNSVTAARAPNHVKGNCLVGLRYLPSLFVGVANLHSLFLVGSLSWVLGRGGGDLEGAGGACSWLTLLVGTGSGDGKLILTVSCKCSIPVQARMKEVVHGIKQAIHKANITSSMLDCHALQSHLLRLH